MTWPMRTAGPTDDGKPAVRGACSECKDPQTVNEVLTSIDCKLSVCAKCARLPQYAKRLAA